MQINLFDKEGSITTSSVYLAYAILKIFEKKKVTSLSFFKLMKCIKELDVRSDPKQISYSMMFLYACGILALDGTDVVLKEVANA